MSGRVGDEALGLLSRSPDDDDDELDALSINRGATRLHRWNAEHLSEQVGAPRDGHVGVGQALQAVALGPALPRHLGCSAGVPELWRPGAGPWGLALAQRSAT